MVSCCCLLCIDILAYPGCGSDFESWDLAPTKAEILQQLTCMDMDNAGVFGGVHDSLGGHDCPAAASWMNNGLDLEELSR